MYNGGGYSLSKRNCQGFVIKLVAKCYDSSAMRPRESWCTTGCPDPIACLFAQSRIYYDEHHSRLKDLVNALLSLGTMLTPLDVCRSDGNIYKARPDFRFRGV